MDSFNSQRFLRLSAMHLFAHPRLKFQSNTFKVSTVIKTLWYVSTQIVRRILGTVRVLLIDQRAVRGLPFF